MKKQIRGSLLPVATLALIGVPGLSSCSESKEQSAVAQNAAEQAPAANDESTKNAKALVKAMSDYL